MLFGWLKRKKKAKKVKEVKKPMTVEETMVYMASLGVSPDKIRKYQNLVKDIERHAQEIKAIKEGK